MQAEKFQRRSSSVRAMEIRYVTPESAAALSEWCKFAYVDAATNHIMLSTPRGPVTIERQDWVIEECGVFTVLKAREFRSLYAKPLNPYQAVLRAMENTKTPMTENLDVLVDALRRELGLPDVDD